MKYLKSLLSGIITTSASFNPYLWPVSLYGLILLHQEIQKHNKLYFIGLTWGIGFYSLSYYWIINPIHNMAHLPFYLSMLFTIIAIIYFAQLPALTLLAIEKIDKKILSIVILWGLGEYLVSLFSITFPWSLIGYLMVKAPWVNLAQIGGVYLVGMVTMLIAGLFKKPTCKYQVTLILLIALTPLLLYQNNSNIGTLNISWAQTYRQENQKWQQPYRINKSLLKNSKNAIDLRIWPEGALSWVLEDYPPNIYTPATLTGIFHSYKGKIYNSAALFDKNNISIVSKKYLVPFGEYIPFYNLIEPLLRNLNIPMSKLTSDNHLSIINFKKFKLATLICYEIAFPIWVWKNIKQSNALILITDDHWFKSNLAIQQHLNIFKMRLIEANKSGVFVNDNGKSQIINMQSGKGLAMSNHQTPIIKYNNYLMLIIFIILLLLRLISERFDN